MKYDTTRIAWMLLLVTTVLGAAGCTGSDPLDSGNFLVTFPISREGSVSGNWDCAILEIRELTFTPADGVCTGGPRDGEPCHDTTDCRNPGDPVGAEICEGNDSVVTIPQSVALLANEAGGFHFTPTSCPTASPFQVGVVEGATKLPSFVLPSGYYQIDNLNVGAAILARLDFDQKRCQNNLSQACTTDAECATGEGPCVSSGFCTQLADSSCPCVTRLDCPPNPPFGAGFTEPNPRNPNSTETICPIAIDRGQPGLNDDVIQECGVPFETPLSTAFRKCNGLLGEVASRYGNKRFFRVGEGEPNIVPIVLDLDLLEAALPNPAFGQACAGFPEALGENITNIFQIQPDP